MERPQSARWMRTGLRVFAVMAPLAIAGVITSAVHGPGALTATFVSLAIVFALTGAVIGSIGVRKATAEGRAIVAEARAERERAARGD